MYIADVNIGQIVDHITQEGLGKTYILLVASGDRDSIPGIISGLNKIKASFFGALFPQVFMDDQCYDKGLVILSFQELVALHIISLDSDDIEIPNLQFDSSDDLCAITFVDAMNESSAGYLSKFYGIYGRQFNYFGAGAGSGDLNFNIHPCVFSPKGFFEKKAVFALVKTKVSLGVKHGWQKLDGPFLATKITKNTLDHLNWEKAFDVYKRVVEKDSGEHIDESNFFEFSQRYPLGVFKSDEDHIIRTPTVVNEEGGISLIGEIAENAVIDILRSSPEELTEAARMVAQECVKNAERFSKAIVFDCYARQLFMEEKFGNELRAIKSEISVGKQKDVHVYGALSLGEISSVGNGYLDFLNTTIIIGLFDES